MVESCIHLPRDSCFEYVCHLTRVGLLPSMPTSFYPTYIDYCSQARRIKGISRAITKIAGSCRFNDHYVPYINTEILFRAFLFCTCANVDVHLLESFHPYFCPVQKDRFDRAHQQPSQANIYHKTAQDQ